MCARADTSVRVWVMGSFTGAFTRLELLATLGGVGLLAMVGLPLLANNGPRSERIACINNLRSIGWAFTSWASDHSDLKPWIAIARNVGPPPPQDNLLDKAWFQFAVVSNELRSPKLLADPGDKRTSPPLNAAISWENSPNGGFVNKKYQNAALSYFIGLHTLADQPRSLLSGDRNIATEGLNANCSLGVGRTTVIPDPSPRVAWTNSVHGEMGNILFNDGQVQQLNSGELKKALSGVPSDHGEHHFLFPF